MADVYQNQFLAMGTRMDIVLPGLSEDFGTELSSVIARQIEEVEQSLSVYRTDSGVSKLNRLFRGSGSIVIDDAFLFDALEFSSDAYRMTKGYFDIAYGGSGNFGQVCLDRKNQRIEVERPGIRLDFGALGKGLAIDKARACLECAGIDNGLISFGESSILALGCHPLGESWPLGISHPEKSAEFVHVFQITDVSLTVSSTLHNGSDGSCTMHSHIKNPFTGQLVDEAKTVAVVAKSAAIGEVLSTSLVVALDGEQRDIVENANISEAVSIVFEGSGMEKQRSWRKVILK